MTPDTPVSVATLASLAPEIMLVASAIVIYLAGAFAGWRGGWLLAFVGTLAAIWLATPAGDGLAGFARWATLLTGLVLVLVQGGDLRTPAANRAGTCEEAGSFLVLLAGLSLVATADDLVLLFLGLEMVSIPTYVLLGLARTTAKGQEATVKYFFLSLTASALFLYGLVCLYGIGGDVSLAVIGERLRETDAVTAAALLPLAVGMVIAGVTFRMAAVPMHFYAPDVYEGTSTPLAAVLSTLPKLAGVVVLLRLVGLTTGTGGAAAVSAGMIWQVTAILAAVTMTVGNLMALWQDNLRRLFACSSIAHAGYLLVGLAAAAAGAGDEARLDGGSATLFYLATYLIATTGVLAAVTYLGHRWPIWSPTTPRPPREEVSTIADLNGLASTNPVAAFAIAVFVLSLAGIPPLPGFWGKLSLVTAALGVDQAGEFTVGGPRTWFVGLAITLAVNAAIAAAYYLRIIAAIYFRPAERGVQADGGLSAGLAMLSCLLAVAMASLQPSLLSGPAGRAVAPALAPEAAPAAPTTAVVNP